MNKILLAILIIIILVVGGYLIWQYWSKVQPVANNQQAVSAISPDNDIIASFLLKGAESWSDDQSAKAFCDSRVTWEENISPIRKVVYSIANCGLVVLKDGDLRGTSWAEESGLFLLENSNNAWEIVDSFQHESGISFPIGKNWVDTYHPLLSDEARFGFSVNRFSTEGIIDQAAQYYGVKVPKYSLNSCSSNRDCQKGDICVKHGVHSNFGPSTCVKACSANKDCGIAHTCRRQCVNGENGCPLTAKAICLPDLLHADLEKNPNEII